jgi:hypothetical protein
MDEFERRVNAFAFLKTLKNNDLWEQFRVNYFHKSLFFNFFVPMHQQRMRVNWDNWVG